MDFGEFAKLLDGQRAKLEEAERLEELVTSSLRGDDKVEAHRAFRLVREAMLANGVLVRMLAALPRMISEQELTTHVLEVLRSPDAGIALAEGEANAISLWGTLLTLLETGEYPQLAARVVRVLQSSEPVPASN